MTVSQRIDQALSRATCPLCGNDRETIFRFDHETGEMVCREHGPFRRRFERHVMNVTWPR